MEKVQLFQIVLDIFTGSPMKFGDKDRALSASRDMDMLRRNSPEGWSGVKEIRKWRDMRNYF
jgi:hypothetical protein